MRVIYGMEGAMVKKLENTIHKRLNNREAGALRFHLLLGWDWMGEGMTADGDGGKGSCAYCERKCSQDILVRLS